MSKLTSLKALRRTKILMGYYGGKAPFHLLQKGDLLLVFENRESLTDFARQHTFLELGYVKKMFFSELVEGLAVGGAYGLSPNVCRLFDTTWRTYIGTSPITAASYEQGLDFIPVSGTF